MKKNKLYIMILLLFSLMFFNYTVYAANGKPATQVSNITSVNIGEQMDSKYSFTIKNNNDTKIEFWGNTGKHFVFTDGSYEIYAIYPQDDKLSGNIGCWIYNVGTYNGQKVAVKCTFYWKPLTVKGTKIYPYIGVNRNKQTLGFQFCHQAYEVKYELYTVASNGEKKELYANLGMSIGDIDYSQYFGLKTDAKINKIICSKDTIVYYEYADGYHWNYDSNNIGSEEGPESMIRYEVENVHQFYLVMGAEYDGYSYYITTDKNSNHKTDGTIVQVNNEYKAFWNNSNNISGKRFLSSELKNVLSVGGGGYFNAVGFGPYSVADPIKSVNKVQISNEEKFIYNISHRIPDNSTYPYKSYQFKDTLAECLKVDSISDIVITNDKGENVTSKFNVSISGQVVLATLKDPSQSSFYNNEYTVSITAHKKADYNTIENEIAYEGIKYKYNKENGIYSVPNIAHYIIDGKDYKSNTSYANIIITHNITTSVNGNGGTISGQNDAVYENVLHRADAQKSIVITPKANYKIKSISINGKDIEFTPSQDKIYTLKLTDITEDKNVVVTFERVPTYIVINYVDKYDTENILDTKRIEGLAGDVYDTTKKEINGYIYSDEINEASNGYLPESPITITYYYIKQSNVVSKYIDENSNSNIIDDILQIYKEKEEYTTEEKQFEGYRLVGKTDNTSGIVARENIEVIYKYKKISAGVEIKYIDQVTLEEISETEYIEGLENDMYSSESKIIDGYELVVTPQNKSGNMSVDKTIVTYEYRKKFNVTVKYIDENTSEEIVPSIVTTYKEGDSYDSENKDLDKYTYTGDTGNAKGIVGRENIEVIYKYKKNSYGVEIRHIDQATNRIIAESTFITGLEMDEYTSNPQEIEGYELVKIPENSSGNMAVDRIVVIYEYRKNYNVLTRYIDENSGNVLHEEVIEKYKQGDKYSTVKEDIEGYTYTKIDGKEMGTVENKNIIVTYYYKKNTSVIVRYVDMLNGNIKIADDVIINGLEGDEYSTEPIDVSQYKLEKIDGNKNGTMLSDTIIIVYNYKRVANLITIHIDENTSEKITDDIVTLYKQGESYEAYAQNIQGYVLVSEPEDKTGIMGTDDIIKEFYYKRISGGLIVKYVDKITGEQLEQKLYEGNENDVIKPEQKSFDGYVLVDNPSFDDVRLGVEPKELVYYYKKEISIDIIGIDEETSEVIYSDKISGLEGEKYETTPMEIGKYNLVYVPDNQNGIYSRENNEIVYKYRKKSGGLVVKYIDKDLDKELDSYMLDGNSGDNYIINRKEFENYNFVEIIGEEIGKLSENKKEVILYYTRKTGKVVIKYIDVVGNVLLKDEITGKVEEQYKVDSKEIEGYNIITVPEKTEGTFIDGIIELIFILDKKEIGVIIIKYLDENGNIIKEQYYEEGEVGKEFINELPQIPGYELISENKIKTEFVSGEAVFVAKYRKIDNYIPDTSDVLKPTILVTIITCIFGILYVILKNKKEEN